MGFSKRAKTIWWILLIGILTYLLSHRYVAIVNGLAEPLDIFIFLIWVCLLLIPIFEEVNIFGIKLKNEIDSLKKDIKQQILNLRNYIQNSINVQTYFNPQLTMAPPPDAKLTTLEERFKVILEDSLKDLGVTRPTDNSMDYEVPYEVNKLFYVRYQIEKELRRIWNQRFKYGEDDDRRSHVPMVKITRSLIESQLIDSKLGHIISEVYAICSPAIHGEDISDRQIKFVEDIAPELIATLKAIQ